MTYRELFALAQDKGYRLKMARDISDTGIINTEDYLFGDEAEVHGHYNADNIRESSYLEMCLIQQWLLDKQEMYICPIPATGGYWGFSLHSLRMFPHQLDVVTRYASYQEALREGLGQLLIMS